MLTLLRKIRSKLITQNRIKSYLLYAVGEIFLVVVGILIAVNINNGNNQRILNKAEDKSLVRLKADLENDLKRYNYLEGQFAKRIVKLDSTLDLVHNQSTLKHRLDIISTHQIAFFLIEAYTTTFEEMVNTGRLYSMKNKDLWKEIIIYYRQVSKWGRYVEKDNQQLRSLMSQPIYNDYWAIGDKILEEKEISVQQYPWLTRQYSKEMNDIEALLVGARKVFKENKATVRILKRQCEDLLEKLDKLYPEE